MPRLKCPRCSTIIEVASGATPVCPNCGFGSETRSAPPPMAPVAPLPPPPPMGAQPGLSPMSPMPGGPAGGMPQRTSGKAITALVLGIASLCVPYVGIVTGIIAIVFGALSIKEVNANPMQVKGKGMGIAGIVLGAIAIVLYIIVILFVGAFLGSTGLFKCFSDPNAAGCENFRNGTRSQVVPMLLQVLPVGMASALVALAG